MLMRKLETKQMWIMVEMGIDLCGPIEETVSMSNKNNARCIKMIS